MKKIPLSHKQYKWLKIILTWIESRGSFLNEPITVEYPKGSGEIVFIFEPFDLVFNTLLHNQYNEEQKETLNLLGVAYLWYKKEKIKWDGH